MGKNKEYANQYAEYAKEQMRKYGIPASITLAQAILESSNGQSELARKENNHFGIKATKSWLDNGGAYGLYTDDKPNEKFCSYDNVGDSYEHHSQYLRENSRYSECFKLSPDDYKGWAIGLEKAGYATAEDYAARLQRIIEINGLDKYDQEVMSEMRSQGKANGLSGQTAQASQSGKKEYSFPVERKEFILVTSPFGQRQDPTDPTKQQMHKGIDIQCKDDRLLATENNAKVISVNHNANTPGGKSVTLEYSRPDGTAIQCTYMHMSEIHVKVNDVIQSGQTIGVSGNTGTHTTGEHLHFSVKSVSADGSSRIIDPAAYLADISQKGNINLQLLNNGTDLMSKYKEGKDVQHTPAVTPGPEEWMKKILSSEDSGIGMGSNSGDPLINFIVQLFMGMMSIISMLQGQTKQQQLEQATQAAVNKSIDLTPLLPKYKTCTLSMHNGRPLLQMDTGTAQINHYLTGTEQSTLIQTLSNKELSQEEKHQKLTTIFNGISAAYQASQNFEKQLDASRSAEETIKIK